MIINPLSFLVCHIYQGFKSVGSVLIRQIGIMGAAGGSRKARLLNAGLPTKVTK